MVLPSLKDKLRDELTRNITSEPQVVYILSRIRKTLEIDKKLKKYKILKFYCDWALHSEIEDTSPISDFFDAVHSNADNGQAQAAFITFHPFYTDLELFLQEYSLPKDVCTDSASKGAFSKILSTIYSDTPLIKKEIKKRKIIWKDNTDPSSPGFSRGGHLKIE